MIIVITSLYNNASKTPTMFYKYIQGLQNQVVPFGLVLVNDNSTDDTVKIMLASDLPIVQLIENSRNLGLTRSLVRAVKWTQLNIDSHFIVSHDADDVSVPNRLARQSDYMKANNIDVLNSAVCICDVKGQIFNHKPSLISHDDIVSALPQRNIFYHSAVMMKSSIFDTVRYNRRNIRAQDYGLWIDCLKFGFRFGGINEELVIRCKHDNTFGNIHKSNQRRTAQRIRREYQEWLASK